MFILSINILEAVCIYFSFMFLSIIILHLNIYYQRMMCPTTQKSETIYREMWWQLLCGTINGLAISSKWKKLGKSGHILDLIDLVYLTFYRSCLEVFPYNVMLSSSNKSARFRKQAYIPTFLSVFIYGIFMSHDINSVFWLFFFSKENLIAIDTT